MTDCPARAGAAAARLPFCTEIVMAVSLDGSRVLHAPRRRLAESAAAAALLREERAYGAEGLPEGGFAVRALAAMDRAEARAAALRRRRMAVFGRR